MTEGKLSFSYQDGHLKISSEQELFSADVGPENMAVYFLLGRTLLGIQAFENQVAFILSILEFLKTAVLPRTGNEVFAEIRERNSRLTLGQVTSRLGKHISEKEIIDELIAIKHERNKLVHHFWRVLDWPFQNEGEVQREFGLAEHLRKRMLHGQLMLAEHVQASDSRIKLNYGSVDIEAKKVIMEDGSEAERVKPQKTPYGPA